MKKLLGLFVALCSCSADPGNEPRFEPSESRPHGFSDPQPITATSREAPHKTVVAMQACADKFASKLSGTSDSYAVLYDLTVTGDGITATVKDSTFPGTELEACLKGALERMVMQDSVSTLPSPQGRSMLGVVQVVAAPIALLPIVLVAGGITIVVGVSIYALAETYRRWPTDDNDDDCTARYDKCIDSGGGAQRGNSWHESRCGTCRAVCQKEKSWPPFVPIFGKGMVPCP